MTGYTRQALSEIQDGEDVIAEPLNREYNALQVAFNGTSGHTHDGGAGNGPKINLTTSVTGILPAANGGLGSGGILPISNGGTGSTTGDTAAAALGLISAKDISGTGTVTGSANVITLDTDRNYTVYNNTLYVTFKAIASNTGSVTLNIDGVGAKPIKKVEQGGESALALGDLFVGGIYTVRYDTAANSGTGAFIAMNLSKSTNYLIGDFFETIRTLDSTWLKRNGGVYNISSYPLLAAQLPTLPDGVTWSNVSTGSGTGFTCIIPKGTGTGFILGRSTNSGGTYTSEIFSSTDGESWTLVATIGSNFAVSCLTYGAGVYVAGSDNGQISVSNDGIFWGAPTIFLPGTSPGITGIAYGAGVFTAICTSSSGRTIYSSADTVTWTLRHTIVGLPRGMDFVNSVFIATSTAGGIDTSTDGITYSQKTTRRVKYTQKVLGSATSSCSPST